MEGYSDASLGGFCAWNGKALKYIAGNLVQTVVKERNACRQLSINPQLHRSNLQLDLRYQQITQDKQEMDGLVFVLLQCCC